MISTAIVLRLICVLNALLVNHDLPQIDQLIRNGEVNYNIIYHIEEILRKTQNFLALAVLRQTMGGDTRLLDEIFNDPNHASRQRSGRCYRITQNNNPVRQETSESNRRTENDNILDTVSEDGSIERHRNVPARRPRQRDEAPSAPHRPGTRGPQADGGKSPPPSVPNLTPSTEASFAQPVLPLQNPPPSHCCLCGKDIHVNSRPDCPIWLRIRRMVSELNPQNLQMFIAEINKYDSEILHSIQLRMSSPRAVIDDIISSLQRRFRHNEEKCVLCFLNYLFQRIGHIDLANAVRTMQFD